LFIPSAAAMSSLRHFPYGRRSRRTSQRQKAFVRIIIAHDVARPQGGDRAIDFFNLRISKRGRISARKVNPG
jgi:hypothetical protein